LHHATGVLPARRNLPRGGGRVMCCRLIGQRCDIYRAVVLIRNDEMQSNAYLVSGVGLVVHCPAIDT
jgi:hypothetical protein